MKEETTNQVRPEADILERSIVALISLIQSNFKKILFACLAGGAVGAGLSTLVTKQYSSSIQILPEFNSASTSNFSSLVNLAGIDLSQRSESNAFRPDLYPTVLTSTTAVVYLLRQPVVTKENKKYPTMIQYLDTFSEEKTPKGELQSQVPDPTVWRFNQQEKNLIESVRGKIKANFDKKSGIVVLDIEMPDPEIAALSSALLTKYLQNFLSDYRTQKKRDQSTFLTNRVKAAKERLASAEYALQSYRDKNRNIVSNVAQIQEQKLQFEFMQRQGVHNDLVNQLEKSRIEELQQDDILITVENPIVPLKHSSPRKLFYAIGGSIAAFMMLMLVLFKPWKLFF